MVYKDHAFKDVVYEDRAFGGVATPSEGVVFINYAQRGVYSKDFPQMLILE